jgi:Ca2+-binding EF-hand superfamily protein
MVSNLAKERFAQLMQEMGESERRLEVTRQVLLSRREFDGLASYGRITRNMYGGITLLELKDFFNECDVYPDSYELDLLFVHVDYDQDAILSFDEFMNLIMSREERVNPEHGKEVKFSIEVENSMLRVFQQELANQKELEKKRRNLWGTPDLQEGVLFDLLDVNKHGNLTVEDFHNFLHPYLGKNRHKLVTTERLFRRMDEDQDGKVSYDEFVRGLRPIYCYNYHTDVLPEHAKLSGPKVILKDKEPAPLRSPTKKREKKAAENKLKLTQSHFDQSVKAEENAGVKSPGIRGMNRTMNPYENYETTAGRIDSPLRRGALDGHYGLHADNPGYHPYRHPGMYGHPSMNGGTGKGGQGPLAGYMPGLGYLPWLEPSSEDVSGRGDHILDHPVHSQRRLVERSMDHPDWVHPGVTNEVRERLIRERELGLYRSVNPALTWSNPGPLQTPSDTDYLSQIQAKSGQLGKDEFNVMNGSFVQTGIQATDNKMRMIAFLRSSIEDNKTLEEKRKTLAMRSDFNVTDLFNMIDGGDTGYLSLNDLDHFSIEYKVSVSRADWENMIARFDLDKDGMLCFGEFSELWKPYTKTYRSSVEGRQQNLCTKFSAYTVQSRKLLKDLLYSVITSEENFEAGKFRLTGGLVSVSSELFDFIDKNKDGFVTLNEFGACLVENSVKVSKAVLGNVFNQFDRDHDGKISFDDFHTPKQVTIATAYGGTGEGQQPAHAMMNMGGSMTQWGMGPNMMNSGSWNPAMMGYGMGMGHPGMMMGGSMGPGMLPPPSMWVPPNERMAPLERLTSPLKKPIGN